MNVKETFRLTFFFFLRRWSFIYFHVFVSQTPRIGKSEPKWWSHWQSKSLILQLYFQICSRITQILFNFIYINTFIFILTLCALLSRFLQCIGMLMLEVTKTATACSYFHRELPFLNLLYTYYAFRKIFLQPSFSCKVVPLYKGWTQPEWMQQY